MKHAPLKRRCGNTDCTRKALPCNTLCIKHETKKREAIKRKIRERQYA